MKSILLIALSAVVLLLSACLSPQGKSLATSIKGKFMNDQKTPWETFVFAPRHYPIELVDGETFWLYDNGARIGFTAHANGGWRSAGAQAGGGSMLPDGINLTWLSPTEGKYYHVRARIPKEMILREFNRKLSIDIRDKLETDRFKEIQFALSPGGFISMRLGWAQVKEVAQFQAKEVDISWEYFAEANHFNLEGLSEEKYLAGFTDKLPEHIQEQRADGTIPYDRWKAFNTQKFPWHLATTLDLHGYTDKQAVPAWYRIYFKREGKRYRGDIIVTQNDPDQREQPEGDVEIFNIFKQYFTEDKRPAALVMDIVDGQIVAHLDNGITKKLLPLYKSNYRVLKEDEYPWFK